MPVQLKRCAPYLPVRDVRSAADFYREKLNFSIEYMAGEPPEFAIVSRDGHPVMFRRVDGAIVPNEAQGGTWDIFFWVVDADELFAEFRAADVDIAYPVRLTEYGTREFAIRDGHGYVLGFGQQL